MVGARISALDSGVSESNETLYPTALATSAPTPSGGLGTDWWYLTSSTCLVWGISASDSNAVAIQYAFEFVLSDGLSDDEKDQVIIVTSFVGADAGSGDDYQYARDRLRVRLTDRRGLSGDDVNPIDDKVSKGYVEVSVRAWSQSTEAAHKVEDALRETESEPVWIIEPLKEQGVRSVQQVQVMDVITTFTSVGPPLSASASPARLSLVILGTVLAFTAIAACIGFVASFPRRHPDALPFVRDKARLALNMVTPQRLLARVRQQQGFELANSHESEAETEVESNDSDTSTVTIAFGGPLSLSSPPIKLQENV